MFSALKALITGTTLLISVAVAAMALPASAAASTPAPFGQFSVATQHRDGSIDVTGWVFDRSNPSTSIAGCLAVNDRCVRPVHANRYSPHFDALHRITGRHRFWAHVSKQPPGVRLELRAGPGSRIALRSLRVLTPGARVINIAKRFVGRVAYVYGGASPSNGFDCSGYALYAYKHAHVANLPHNAEAQRHVRYMHRIPRSNALPGDLVFYFSGGYAYHVAIYGGNGTQYSATDPAEGITHQRIWAHNVQFGTDWH